MRFSLLPALALLAACDVPSQAQKTAYDLTEAGTVAHALCLLGFSGVPLRSIVTGHHLVDVEINGRKASFVLDTGANATVLHAPLAAELGLGQGTAVPGTAIGLGGSLQARQVAIESTTLGGVPIRRKRIITADLSQIANVLGPLSGSKIYGIVGQDVMKEHRAVIDVDGPTLYLIRADRGPAPVPAESCGGGRQAAGTKQG